MKKIYYSFFLMMLLTSSLVMAVDFDSKRDVFVLSPGDESFGYFVLSDIDTNVSISTEQDGFVDFDGEYILSYDDLAVVYDGYYSVKYTVSVPENSEIGLYNQRIIVDDESFVVKLFIEKTFFAKTYNRLQGSVNIGGYSANAGTITLFIIVVLFIIMTVYLYTTVRSKK